MFGFKPGHFLVPKQLEPARTDGLKKTASRLLIKRVAEEQLWSTASSSCLLDKYTP